MNVAVSTRLLLQGRLEGIGVFTRETLSRLCRAHADVRFHFFFDRPWADEFIFAGNVTPYVLHPPTRHPLLWLAWLEWSLPRALARCRADVFLAPDGLMSLRSAVPAIPVLHDLNFEHYPEHLPLAYRRYYRTFFPRFAHAAARIVTVSEFTKRDIVQRYGIDPAGVDVVYNSAATHFRPATEAEQQAARAKFSAGRPYFYFVGLLHQRKNIANLFRAFDLFKRDDSRGCKLLIVGARKWWSDDIRAAYEAMRYRDDIVFTGRVSDADLRLISASALALSYVPYFEGFGIPIVEAMYCDTAVICSAISSMPEVAGDAALLVDPFEPESIAGAMQKIAADSALRNELRARGRARRAAFSWERSAELLWQSIAEAAGRS